METDGETDLVIPAIRSSKSKLPVVLRLVLCPSGVISLHSSSDFNSYGNYGTMLLYTTLPSPGPGPLSMPGVIANRSAHYKFFFFFSA